MFYREILYYRDNIFVKILYFTDTREKKVFHKQYLKRDELSYFKSLESFAMKMNNTIFTTVKNRIQRNVSC